MHLRLVRGLPVAVLVVVLAMQAFALAPAAWAGTPWPHEASDLKPDPTVRFGVLPNGLRYAIKPNANPAGTVTVRIRIAAGSLHETEKELGVAHFLEHMAFNGSENYPEGEMFKALQRLGIQIGSSANASTDFDNTTFALSLPSTRPDTLNTGFKILREIVGSLTLSEEAIVRERGVILSEERARDTPGMRANLAQLHALFAGQKYPNRFPIGKLEFIKNATSAQLRSFYERHYRPERALLVVAGDVDPVMMEAKIKAVFGDWSQPGPAAPAENFGAPAKRGLVAAYSVQPGLEESVTLNWIQPEDTRGDKKARRSEIHQRIVGFTVLNRRLSKLARTADAPFIDARVAREVVQGGGIVSALTVRTRAGGWAKGLQAAEQELRRALTHGLQQEEVSREALEQKSPYLLVAANAKTRSNIEMADWLLMTLDSGRVPTDPQTDLDLYTQSITGMKAATVTNALKATFSGSGPIIFVTTSQPVVGGEDAIKLAYTQSRAVAVAAPPPSTIKEFSYRDFGPKGTVAERKTVADIDATLVRFANGVKLNVKSTNFEKDKVSVVVRVAGGYLALPKKRGVAWALPFAFVEGGLGKLTIGELEQTEPGHFAGIFLDVDEDVFQIAGDTVERDTLLQLQVLAAYFTDAAYRPDGLKRIQAAGEGQLRQQDTTASGVLSRELPGLVHGNDPRWASPDIDDIRKITMEDVKAAIAPSLAQAPIEVTIVGHVKVEDAIEATAKTFGALAPRAGAYKIPEGARNVSFPAKGGRADFKHEGRPDQAAVVAAWPGPDLFSNTRLDRAVAILNEVIQLRLIDEVREKQGSTYTPFGSYWASKSVKGFGYMFAGVEPKPEESDKFFETLAEITQELRNGELSADLLERARKPVLYQHYAAESTNAYWIQSLSDIQSDPRKLERVRSALKDYGTITEAEVIAAAKLFLDDKRRIDMRVVPKS
jgi:zinc protease